MLSIQGSAELRRIVVINPKGGAGKTTLASNIAGYFAATGRKVAIIDMDKLGTSTHWLGRRPAEFPAIHSVFAAPDQPGVPPGFSVMLPAEIELAVVDAPAGVPKESLPGFTVGSHAIVVPVMPSEFDVHAASRLIADLLLVARVSRESGRLGVIANRVKERTIAFKQLMKFLNRLSIPIVGVIRDSQNYVSAAREGISIHELPKSKAGKDLKHWESVTAWLEQRIATPLNERDLQSPKPKLEVEIEAPSAAFPPARGSNWKFAIAPVLVLLVASIWFWQFAGRSDPGLALEPTAAPAATQRPPATEAGLAESAEPVEPAAPAPGVIADDRRIDPDVATDFAGDSSTPLATAPVADATLADATLAQRGHSEPARPGQGESGRPSSARISAKWRLSGVAQGGANPVVFLTDTSNSSTRRVTATVHVDGWRLKTAGADYAVLENDGSEIRLKLSE